MLVPGALGLSKSTSTFTVRPLDSINGSTCVTVAVSSAGTSVPDGSGHRWTSPLRVPTTRKPFSAGGLNAAHVAADQSRVTNRADLGPARLGRRGPPQLHDPLGPAGRGDQPVVRLLVHLRRPGGERGEADRPPRPSPAAAPCACPAGGSRPAAVLSASSKSRDPSSVTPGMGTSPERESIRCSTPGARPADRPDADGRLPAGRHHPSLRGEVSAVIGLWCSRPGMRTCACRWPPRTCRWPARRRSRSTGRPG